MRSRTKGEISNTEKFNKEISRVKFSASHFQGEGHFPRAQSKMEREVWNKMPYVRVCEIYPEVVRANTRAEHLVL